MMRQPQNQVILLNFLHYTALYASRPYLSLLAQDLGGSELEIGVTVSLYSFIQVFTALPAGRWIARRGPKRPSCFGTFSFLCGTVLLMFTSDLRLAGLSSLLLGAGHGLILLCGQHSVTGIADDTARTAAVGWLSFFNSVGTALGPLLGGKLRDLSGSGLGFSGARLLSLASFFAALRMAHGQPKGGETERVRPALQKPVVLDIFLSGAVFFAADVLPVYLPLYTSQLGLSSFLTGAVLSANGIAQMAVRPFMGHLRKWYSVRQLLQKCLLTGGVCIALIGAIPAFGGILLTAALAGCTIGLANPLTLLTVSSAANDAERSQILALRVMANYGAQALSPIILGEVSGVMGLAPVLWCGGGILFLSGITINMNHSAL